MIIELFELASNNALEHAPQSLTKIKALEGKTMALHLKPIDQSIAISCYPEGLEFSRTLPENVDVNLTATVGAMIKISRHGMDKADLQPGELEISGDPIVGQKFAQVISDLDIDWESFLADHIGDSSAQWVSFFASKAKDIADDASSDFKSRLRHFVTEESGIIASKKELEDFLDGVDNVKSETDKLQSRISLLKTNL